MTSTLPARSRALDTVLSVGAPLLSIATLALLRHVEVGALVTIWAAVLAGVCVPVLTRFVSVPFLKMCEIDQNSPTATVFLFVLNAATGLLCAIAVLPLPS